MTRPGPALAEHCQHYPPEILDAAANRLLACYGCRKYDEAKLNCARYCRNCDGYAVWFSVLVSKDCRFYESAQCPAS